MAVERDRPYAQFNFLVDLGTGNTAGPEAGFQECSEIGMTVDVIEYLNVRIDRVWTFDSWMLDAYLDVLNAYNHRSVEGSVYSYDFSQHAYFEGLPIIPTLGLKGSF